MRILFATDGSPSAETALDMLIDLRLRSHDHVTVLAIPVRSYVGIGYDGSGTFFAEIAEEEERTARRVADKAVSRIRAAGSAAEAAVVDGPIPQTIIETAQTAHAGLIVLGSRGLGRIAGALLGSTARAVARHSDVPVLVVRDRRTAPKRILVATDGSDDAAAAVGVLASLPLPGKTQVTLLNVQPKRDLHDVPAGALADELVAAAEREEREDALDVVAHARQLLPAGVSARVQLEHGRATERILATAVAEGSDLIVLGARGRTLRGDRFLQGSTADRIIENAHCAVLVARAQRPVRVGKPANGRVAVGAAGQ